MTAGCGTIQAQTQALHRVFLQANEHVTGERWRRGRGDGYTNAELACLVDQIEQVCASEWITSGENQLRHWVAKFSNLAQERDTLIESKLHGVRRRNRFGAAVAACQCTCPCDFPVNVHRRSRVISWSVVAGGAMMGECLSLHACRMAFLIP